VNARKRFFKATAGLSRSSNGAVAPDASRYFTVRAKNHRLRTRFAPVNAGRFAHAQMPNIEMIKTPGGSTTYPECARGALSRHYWPYAGDREGWEVAGVGRETGGGNTHPSSVG